MPIQDLEASPMMAHLLRHLKNGDDIGHYGRLTFVMVARHFVSDDEMVELLQNDKDCTEEKARTLVSQVEARKYSPPRPERILNWMSQQEFPICPDDNPDHCNVYKDLTFSEDTYNKISSYYEQQSKTEAAS